MTDDHPLDLQLLIEMVRYLQIRATSTSQGATGDPVAVANLVNMVMPGATLGSVFGSATIQFDQSSQGDTYLTNQAVAVGRGATAQGFQQVWLDIREDVDLGALAQELPALRTAMRSRLSGSTQDELTLSQVAQAEVAAQAGDGPGVLTYLARAGSWALDVAKDVGASAVAAVIEKALGLS